MFQQHFPEWNISNRIGMYQVRVSQHHNEVKISRRLKISLIRSYHEWIEMHTQQMGIVVASLYLIVTMEHIVHRIILHITQYHHFWIIEYCIMHIILENNRWNTIALLYIICMYITAMHNTMHTMDTTTTNIRHIPRSITGENTTNTEYREYVTGIRTMKIIRSCR